jgi:hypothetical protein
MVVKSAKDGRRYNVATVLDGAMDRNTTDAEVPRFLLQAGSST